MFQEIGLVYGFRLVTRDFQKRLMILKEFYIENKHGVELSSWNDEMIEFRTQCLVFDGG